MSIIEGFTAKFNEVCDEICALREQFATLSEKVAALEDALSNSKTPASNARSVTQPAPVTSRTPTK